MDVLMPQLGETVAEGKIVKWFKAAGDAVKPGDNLFEIETDKTSMEVPATAAGTLTDIRFQVGEVAKVGAVVAVIAVAARRTICAHARTSGGPEPKRTRVPACAGTSGEPRRPSRFRSPRRGGTARARRAFGARVLCLSARWTPSARCVRPSAISARPGCRAAPSSRRWPAAWPASAASISRASPAPARMAASSPRDVETAAPAAPSRRWRRGASAAQVKALYEGVAYEEVPLDSMRAHHRHAAGRGQADHPAFLSHRRSSRSAG